MTMNPGELMGKKGFTAQIITKYTIFTDSIELEKFQQDNPRHRIVSIVPIPNEIKAKNNDIESGSFKNTVAVFVTYYEMSPIDRLQNYELDIEEQEHIFEFIKEKIIKERKQ